MCSVHLCRRSRLECVSMFYEVLLPTPMARALSGCWWNVGKRRHQRVGLLLVVIYLITVPVYVRRGLCLVCVPLCTRLRLLTRDVKAESYVICGSCGDSPSVW